MCAVWSERFGLQVSPRSQLERRTDLTGVLLRGTSEAESPFILTPPAERPEELGSGQVWREGRGWAQVRVEQFCGEIWSGLQEATNFSFSMVGIRSRALWPHGCHKVTKFLTLKLNKYPG